MSNGETSNKPKYVIDGDMALVERVVEEDVEELEKEYSVEITEESIKESYDTMYVNMGRTLSILMK